MFALLAPLFLPGCLLPVPQLENAAADGRWAVTVKNETDGCTFDNWVPGAVAGFEIVIEQFGEENRELAARLDGLAGLALWVGLGTAELKGRVEGNELSLILRGVNNETASDGCVFRRELRVTAEVDGDRLVGGRIAHFPMRTGAPECPNLVNCEALQTFDGRRVGD